MAQEKVLDVEIVTPQKVIYTGKAVSVSVPGSLCPFQILYNHAPIVSNLDYGIVKIVDDSEKTILLATSPGFTEVRQNQVSILVESAEEASAIDTEKAALEFEEAIELIKKSEDAQEKEEALKTLKHSENLLKTAQKYRERN